MPPFSFGGCMFWKREKTDPDLIQFGEAYLKKLLEPNPRIQKIKEEALIKALEEQGLMPKSELEQSQDPNHTGGRKFDGGKLQYGLLPPLALKETVRVLTFGAEKYEPDNWRRVPDGARRYFDAAQRHLWAYREGERYDPETEVNHLAHAICCLMFMLDLDEQGVNDTIIKQQIKKKISKGRMESGI